MSEYSTRRTFTENLLAYAIGRRVEYSDMPTVRAIVKNAEANNLKMSAFIMGVIKSDPFQMKRAESPTTTDVAGGPSKLGPHTR
jgi:hypothetical protein